MADDVQLDEILKTWQEGCDRGESVDPEEIVRAHPELADRLRQRFTALAMLDEIFAESGAMSPEAPEQIADYTIERELGSGGMGTVYLASRGEERVAIKVLHSHLLARPGVFKRFLREAQAGRQIRHENVVRTLDVDAALVNGSQVNYLVMEYVEGKTLARLLKDLGTVPEALLREIAAQIVSGLAAIHAQGIVHRDIKPENVIITQDHEVRIMDLGIAHVAQQSFVLTGDGDFAGSLHYAAPEQFAGGEAGAGADLYSLGVLLYEMATGENPFRWAEVAKVVAAHTGETPPSICEQNEDVTPFFGELVATLLKKKPEQRFGSAAALGRVIEEGESSSWWVERERALRRDSRRRPRIQVRRETELHGREEVLARLQQCWDGAKQQQGNTILLEGEAGIGKTRVADAFVQSLADEDAHVLYGSYAPGGGLGGISDAIVQALGREDLEENLRSLLPVMPTLVSPFAALLRHESPPDGGESMQGDALHAVFVQLMKALAADKPLLWVIDDLHFSSRDSRRIVLSLSRATAGHGVLLLTTSRPGFPEDELAHFGRLDNFDRLPVGRLTPREVIELLRVAFRSEDLAEKLGAKIAYKSDGVPFFIFEMIRGLKEGQFIEELPDGTCVQTRVIEEIEVPSAVVDLIEARLSDLSDEDRAFLDIAAVEGFEFDPDLLARVKKVPVFDVLQRLAAAERRSGLIRGHGRNYRFDHHQIQEVIYAQLQDRLREECHALLAEAFVERAGLDGEAAATGEDAVFLSSHHLRGSRPRSGQIHVRPALRHLASAYRHEAQVVLGDQALAAVDLLEGDERVRVLLRKEGALHFLGQRDEQKLALHEAQALAENSSDAVMRARVCSGLGRLAGASGCYTDAVEIHREALSAAREAECDEWELVALQNLGACLTHDGRESEGRESTRRALQLAGARGDLAAEAAATINLGTTYVNSDIGEFGRLTRAGLELAEKCGQQNWQAVGQMNLGLFEMTEGRLDEALRRHARSRELSRGIGYRLLEVELMVSCGLILCSLGRHEEAQGLCESGRRLALEIDHRRGECNALRGLGHVDSAAGRSNEALDLHVRALDLAELLDYAHGRTKALLSLGRALVAQGESQRALERFREAKSASRYPPDTLLAASWSAALIGTGHDVPDVAELECGVAEHSITMESRFLRWKATGDPKHLAEAHRLLEHLRSHAPEQDRDSMVENVPLHREIMQAWENQ